MAQNKSRTVWANVEPMMREALDQYVEQKHTTISEVIRALVANQLIAEGYLEKEQLEAMLV